MKQFFSFAVVAAVMTLPVGVTNVVGGNLVESIGILTVPLIPDCTGSVGVLTCTPVNGAMCNDVGNVYSGGGAAPTVLQSSDNVWCAANNNNNNDCSGSAKKIRTGRCF